MLISTCPRCGKKGFISRRAAKKKAFAYEFTPYTQYDIPKNPPKDLAGAWDYAAKTCIRQMNTVIKFPATVNDDDLSFASVTYKSWMGLMGHTEIDIANFEDRWDFGARIDHRKQESPRFASMSNQMLSNAYEQLQARRKKEGYTRQISAEIMGILKESSKRGLVLQPDYRDKISTPFPRETDCLTHYALSWLYGAICCAVIRDILLNTSNGVLRNSDLIKATWIFWFVASLHSDHRFSYSITGYLKMINDANKCGLGGASTKNAIKSLSGKMVKQTPKQIKKVREKYTNLAIDIINCLPIYMQFLDSLIIFNQQRPNAMAEFRKRFESYVDGRLLHKQEKFSYYFVGHYDHIRYLREKEDFQTGIRKSKPQGRTWCGPLKSAELSSLGLTD